MSFNVNITVFNLLSSKNHDIDNKYNRYVNTKVGFFYFSLLKVSTLYLRVLLRLSFEHSIIATWNWCDTTTFSTTPFYLKKKIWKMISKAYANQNILSYTHSSCNNSMQPCLATDLSLLLWTSEKQPPLWVRAVRHI